LGSPETDLLVEALMKRGPDAGIFGAKISGGGAGGTVVILARRSAQTAIEEVARDYAAKTGKKPQVFSGSSEGAVAAGVERIERN
jgi:L-arabinokinase